MAPQSRSRVAIEKSPIGMRTIGVMPASSAAIEICAGDIERHDAVLEIEEQPVEAADIHDLRNVDGTRVAGCRTPSESSPASSRASAGFSSFSIVVPPVLVWVRSDRRRHDFLVGYVYHAVHPPRLRGGLRRSVRHHYWTNWLGFEIEKLERVQAADLLAVGSPTGPRPDRRARPDCIRPCRPGSRCRCATWSTPYFSIRYLSWSIEKTSVSK